MSGCRVAVIQKSAKVRRFACRDAAFILELSCVHYSQVRWLACMHTCACMHAPAPKTQPTTRTPSTRSPHRSSKTRGLRSAAVAAPVCTICSSRCLWILRWLYRWLWAGMGSPRSLRCRSARGAGSGRARHTLPSSTAGAARGLQTPWRASSAILTELSDFTACITLPLLRLAGWIESADWGPLVWVCDGGVDEELCMLA